MAMLSPAENDIGRKVASCSRASWKRFGSIASNEWSDSDSNFEKENDAKAASTNRLSLSVASDSKHFKTYIYISHENADQLLQGQLL